MATKSKNSLLRSLVFSLAVLLLGYSVLTTANIMIFYDYVKHDSYFKTTGFISRLVRSVYDLQSYYVNYDFENYDKKTSEQKVSNDEVAKVMEEQKNYTDNNIREITDEYAFQIEQFGDNKKEQDRIIAERDKRIDEFKKKSIKSEEEIRKELVKEKDATYNSLKRNVEQWKTIKYYITNKKTGKVYTNLQPNTNISEYINKGVLYQDKYPKKITSMDERIHDEINRVFQESSLEGYFIVPIETETYSEIYWQSLDYQKNRNRLISEGIAGAGALIIALILFIAINRRHEQENTILDNLTGFYIKIPMELRFVFFIGGSFIYLNILGPATTQMLEFPMPLYIAFSIASSIYMFYVLLHIRGFYNLLVNSDNFRVQWSGTLLYKTMDFIYCNIVNRNTTTKAILTNMASFFFAIDLIALVGIHDDFARFLALVYFVAYIVLVPVNVIREAIYLNEVAEGSEEIVAGNFEYVIDEKGRGIIRKLAHNFNNIKGGLRKSLESQMKSERLKSELITNVSHDLKTPLTSIINYVDLLKSKELSEEEREGYIEILDRKSKRLKVLIEDLFEASKMASGTVELEIEQIDIVAILRQTLGEFDEKINNSNLTFRVNIPTEKIYLNLDGKKTWRVFENLINNALKYSQRDTRVYIDLLEDENNVKVIIRNIANYEMNFDPDEIFERFKRGDKSRNTEGSGLGLAIAKSIVEMQKGSMNIELDGDLFKVIVQFRK